MAGKTKLLIFFLNLGKPLPFAYHKGFRSVYKLTAHVVLGTKYRRKAISPEILKRLKEIFANTLVKWESSLVEFNGESDHNTFTNRQV